MGINAFTKTGNTVTFLGSPLRSVSTSQNGENPAETGPQRGFQKARECVSRIAYGGAGGI